VTLELAEKTVTCPSGTWGVGDDLVYEYPHPVELHNAYPLRVADQLGVTSLDVRVGRRSVV